MLSLSEKYYDDYGEYVDILENGAPLVCGVNLEAAQRFVNAMNDDMKKIAQELLDAFAFAVRAAIKNFL